MPSVPPLVKYIKTNFALVRTNSFMSSYDYVDMYIFALVKTNSVMSSYDFVDMYMSFFVLKRIEANLKRFIHH